MVRPVLFVFAFLLAFASCLSLAQAAEPAPFEDLLARYLSAEPPAPTADALPAPKPKGRAEEDERTQPEGCLSLAEVVGLTVQNHPALRLAEARIEAARGAWVQVGLKPNPFLGYMGSEIGNDGAAGQHGIYYQRDIVRGNKLGLNRAVASHDIEREQVALTAAELRVVTQVTLAYFKSLLAQERQRLTGQLATIAEETANSTRRLVEAGELPTTDQLQAEIEFESINKDLIVVKAFRRAALRQLVSAVGMDGLQIESVCGDALQALPQHAWEEDLDRLLYLSPQLAAQQTRIERAKCALVRARAEQIPNLQIQASVQYGDATSDPFAGVMIGRPFQFHNWNQGGIRKAQAELLAAQDELQVLRFQLESQLAERFRNFDAANLAITRYQERILPLAEENLDLVRVGYLAGERNYLELLTAQRSAFRSHLDFLSTVRAAWLAHSQMQGLLLAESTDGL